MPAMVTILLAGAHAKVTGGGCSIFVRISEWVAGDVRSKRHVCHHVYPGRDMIKTMTNNFVTPLAIFIGQRGGCSTCVHIP